MSGSWTCTRLQSHHWRHWHNFALRNFHRVCFKRVGYCFTTRDINETPAAQWCGHEKNSSWAFFGAWVVWCGQVYVQVTHHAWDSGRSMRDLIQVVPFISFVVAITYSIPLSSTWERKRRAAISAYVTPPRKNTSVVRFSPCWPVGQ